MSLHLSSSFCFFSIKAADIWVNIWFYFEPFFFCFGGRGGGGLSFLIVDTYVSGIGEISCQ